jgi:hypothetical protein
VFELLKAALTLKADVRYVPFAGALGELIAADDDVSLELAEVNLVEVGCGAEAEHGSSGVAVP